MNPPTPVPWPTEAPNWTLPVRRSVTRNTTSTSPLSVGCTSGGGIGCWKKFRLETLLYERISASLLKSCPGTMTICSRMTRSWVTSFPRMMIRLTVAGDPSTMVHRRSSQERPSRVVRRIISGSTRE
jgi:hypothetical protein